MKATISITFAAQNGACGAYRVPDKRSEAPPLRRGCQDAIMASGHPRLRSAQCGSRFRTVFRFLCGASEDLEHFTPTPPDIITGLRVLGPLKIDTKG